MKKLLQQTKTRLKALTLRLTLAAMLILTISMAGATEAKQGVPKPQEGRR